MKCHKASLIDDVRVINIYNTKHLYEFTIFGLVVSKKVIF